MGNYHPEKTNVDQGEAGVDIGFQRVIISLVTLSCSQYLYNTPVLPNLMINLKSFKQNIQIAIF